MKQMKQTRVTLVYICVLIAVYAWPGNERSVQPSVHRTQEADAARPRL